MPLWTGHSIKAALNHEALGHDPLGDEPLVEDHLRGLPNLALQRLHCDGVSIDSRTLSPGDLFIAIQGPDHDGHDYVEHAFEAGAAAAVVSRTVPLSDAWVHHPQILTRDTFLALQKLGGYARQRTHAKIAGVTGSVGKTTLKTMLGLILAQQGRTSFSVGSFNNHWGVPLSLARMPEQAEYGVFEMGMNHAGEIRELVHQVQPHAAIITQIGDAHLGHLGSRDAICDAKSEIFESVVKGGVAVLNRDDPFYERLRHNAERCGITHFITFGEHPQADVRMTFYQPGPSVDQVEAVVAGRSYPYALKTRGSHNAQNSLGAMAMVLALGADLRRATEALSALEPLSGRGRRHTLRLPQGQILLCDESYNANPTSMRAAIKLAASEPRPSESGKGRLILALGHMVELGEDSVSLHRALKDDVVAAGADLVLTCGGHMLHLHEVLKPDVACEHFATADELAAAISDIVEDGDVLMVKGSFSTRMGLVVHKLLSTTHHKEGHTGGESPKC